jgi:hypothetical protein
MSIERQWDPFSSQEHSMKVIKMGETAATRLSDASTYLGVHPNTLRRWADDGLVPVIKLPTGVRRFPIDGIMKTKAQMLGEEDKIADLRKPEVIEKLRQFVMGKITAEEAGSAFSYTGDLPTIAIDEETFDFFYRGATKAA